MPAFLAVVTSSGHSPSALFQSAHSTCQVRLFLIPLGTQPRAPFTSYLQTSRGCWLFSSFFLFFDQTLILISNPITGHYARTNSLTINWTSNADHRLRRRRPSHQNQPGLAVAGPPLWRNFHFDFARSALPAPGLSAPEMASLVRAIDQGPNRQFVKRREGLS
jgi:hypothetical protein